jgi:hypothetical protein
MIMTAACVEIPAQATAKEELGSRAISVVIIEG